MRNLVQRYLYYLCCGQYRVGRSAIKRLVLKEEETINTDVATRWPWYVPAENAELNFSAASGFDKVLGWQVWIYFTWQMHLSKDGGWKRALHVCFTWWKSTRRNSIMYVGTQTNYHSKWAWYGVPQPPPFDRCIRHAKLIQTREPSIS